MIEEEKLSDLNYKIKLLKKLRNVDKNVFNDIGKNRVVLDFFLNDLKEKSKKYKYYNENIIIKSIRIFNGIIGLFNELVIGIVRVPITITKLLVNYKCDCSKTNYINFILVMVDVFLELSNLTLDGLKELNNHLLEHRNLIYSHLNNIINREITKQLEVIELYRKTII